MGSRYKPQRDIRECNINYVDVDDVVSVTLYEKRYINKVKKLFESHPDEIRLIETGMKGTICAHLPKKYVHISFGEKRVSKKLSEEQKAKVAERLTTAREAKKENKKANLLE